MSIPTVGRIVHYVSYGTPVQADGTQTYLPECRAAIVTELSDEPQDMLDGRVGLCVLNPTGFFFHPLADGGCLHSELDHNGGTWHWPERVG